MRAIFLGYGVGQFELEFLRGAPQLTDHATNQASVQRGGTAPAEAASRFDLSYVAPANPTAADGAMKSSWATDKNATSSADPEVQRRAAMRREQQEERQAQAQAGGVPWDTPQAGQRKGPSGEMGDPDAAVPLPAQAVDPSEPDPFAALVAASTPASSRVPAPPAVRSQSAQATAAPAAPVSDLPQQMRLIVNGSVVVYQNCMVRC